VRAYRGAEHGALCFSVEAAVKVANNIFVKFFTIHTIVDRRQVRADMVRRLLVAPASFAKLAFLSRFADAGSSAVREWRRAVVRWRPRRVHSWVVRIKKAAGCLAGERGWSPGRIRIVL
jgi:hypothetical protein